MTLATRPEAAGTAPDPHAPERMTRSSALDQARRAYRGLLLRALGADGVDHELALDVYGSWHQKLDRLARYRSDATIGEDTQAALEFLTSAIEREPADADEYVEWLDAFADAVAEMFPPSAMTFRLVEQLVLPDNATGDAARNAA